MFGFCRIKPQHQWFNQMGYFLMKGTVQSSAVGWPLLPSAVRMTGPWCPATWLSLACDSCAHVCLMVIWSLHLQPLICILDRKKEKRKRKKGYLYWGSRTFLETLNLNGSDQNDIIPSPLAGKVSIF